MNVTYQNNGSNDFNKIFNVDRNCIGDNVGIEGFSKLSVVITPWAFTHLIQAARLFLNNCLADFNKIWHDVSNYNLNNFHAPGISKMRVIITPWAFI